MTRNRLLSVLAGLLTLGAGLFTAPAVQAQAASAEVAEEKKVRFLIKKKAEPAAGEPRNTSPPVEFDMFNRANMLILNDKIDEALDRVERREYHLALQLLEVEVLRRTDGCARAGRPDPDDLLTDCAAQSEIYSLVIESIALIHALNDK